MAEKSLEQQILDLRAKLTNEGKSEKEITEAVIQLELDYAEKQRVMPGVTTPEGVEPVVIGKTKPEVITIDGVETRKSDIVQYLEDPSLILNAGGTQADVDKWTQLVNTYDEFEETLLKIVNNFDEWKINNFNKSNIQSGNKKITKYLMEAIYE